MILILPERKDQLRVSPKFKGSGTQAIVTGAEASVRQLIANGKIKIALETAKEITKRRERSPPKHCWWRHTLRGFSRLSSRAWWSRQRLCSTGAGALSVRKDSGSKELSVSAAAHAGTIEELVRTISNDPELSAERRAAIEQAIRNQVHDLAALAGCSALPQEHPLRKAASALHLALSAATSGPLAEDALVLPGCHTAVPLRPGSC